MKRDTLKEFLSLQSSLLKERTSIQARLREIDGVLSADPSAALTAPKAARKAKVKRGPKPKRSGKRAKNELSLKDAVLKVLTAPMTKEEILSAVQKLGYKFATKDPANSLGVILYGKKPKFNRKDGKFSPSKA